MKQQSNKFGYLQVTLGYKNNKKTFLVHRLAAIHFLENNNNLPEVNHKDENKQNNNVDNLEFCDRLYNVRFGTGIKRNIERSLKPILQYDRNGNFIKEYESIKQASEELNKNNSNIVACCKGKRKTAFNYIWKYKQSA